MKAKVNKDVCIGCGACAVIAPDIFEIDDDGLATTKEDNVKDEIKDDVVDACESCPTGAIEINNEDN